MYASQSASSTCETATGTTVERTVEPDTDRARDSTTGEIKGESTERTRVGMMGETAERTRVGITDTGGKTDSMIVLPAGITLSDAALQTATQPINIKKRFMTTTVDFNDLYLIRV